ncbi:hypothetical protein [Yeosuana marina]|uniref:hypothetical protein n=1 Tax=Yeosuana marina TaxID=1565536 RepID=UPI00141E8B15|nr:hypothetical protein [Yeosuana marina]
MKNLVLKITIIISLLLLSSCYSYRIFPKEFRKTKTNLDTKPKAFVINKELEREYKILQESNIYDIVEDSINQLKVKLYPFEQIRKVDGQPIIITFLTLGQVPVNFYDAYSFKFDEIIKNETIENKFELQIAQRVWLWDIFKFNKDFEGKAGKALRGSYLNTIEN